MAVGLYVLDDMETWYNLVAYIYCISVHRHRRFSSKTRFEKWKLNIAIGTEIFIRLYIAENTELYYRHQWHCHCWKHIYIVA